jgi:hypothetical protein
MESSCASAPPAREPENIKAAGKARERETYASDPLEAPQAAEGQETNAPCRREMAESRGTRETNVSEKEAAAARRDGEPLTSVAQEQRQEETADAEYQAAGESSSLSQERTAAKDVPHQVCPDPGAGDKSRGGRIPVGYGRDRLSRDTPDRPSGWERNDAPH